MGWNCFVSAWYPAPQLLQPVVLLGPCCSMRRWLPWRAGTALALGRGP